MDEVELPAAGVWVLDPDHCEVGFIARHLGLARVRGRFTRVQGALTIDEDPADSAIRVSIDMASVSTGSWGRDDHLRSSDFFDVDNFPMATFRSDAVVVDGRLAVVYGELMIKEIVRPVELDVEFLGHAQDPLGHDRIGFRAGATINRKAWGLVWNKFAGNDSLLVSEEIRLDIEAELIRPASLTIGTAQAEAERSGFTPSPT